MKPFTTKQLKALPLLVSGMSGVATAKAVGVQASTVSEWLNHDPMFAAEVDRLRQEASRDAMALFQATLLLATCELRRLLTESKTDAVRLRAAEFVISYAGHFDSPQLPTGCGSKDASGHPVNLRLVLQGLGVAHEL